MGKEQEKTINISLAQIQVTHPETKEVLMRMTPQPDQTFHVQFPEGISNDDLQIVVAEILRQQIHDSVRIQRELSLHGWNPENIRELFFPGVPAGVPTGVPTAVPDAGDA